MIRSLLLTLFTVITLITFAQSETCTITVLPVIDGDGEEWTSSWLEDDDHKFKYNICFDETTIYIRMKTSDELIQRKISTFGLTVWLDPNGKKKTKIGLRYPTGIEAQERMELLQKSGELEREMTAPKREELRKKLKRDMVTNVEVLELIGLADKPLTSTKTGITNGLKVAIDMDAEEAYVYEAAIPFKAFRLSKAQIEVLGVGFETGKFTLSQTKGNGNDAGGGMPAGGFGRSPGMSGGGYNSSPLSTSSKMWTSVKLK